MGYSIGLDLGIASVGWAVVDDNDDVVESGSNLFPAADASRNVERRGFRQGRRLTRRRATRIEDFKKLWVATGFQIPEVINPEVLEIKNIGLNEKLTEDEIYQVLLNSLGHISEATVKKYIDEQKKYD